MRRRARVLSVIGDLGFGGAEHRLLALARNIDRELFEHSVITINQADPDREETCAMRWFRVWVAPSRLARSSARNESSEDATCVSRD